MALVIAVITLLPMLMVDEAEADAVSDSLLARKFSPILILTEETGTEYDENEPIRVLKPEPVEIVGADSSADLRFELWTVPPQPRIPSRKVGDVDSFRNWNPPLTSSRVNFSQNKFAFFANGFEYAGDPPGDPPDSTYSVHAYFDYPGETATVWNDTYFGTGMHRGKNYPNTAYVRIYERTITAYQALYPVTTLCRVLGVSSSGYYAWRMRRPSVRRQADASLQAHIEAIHAWSDGTYGTPRILAQLRQEGVHVGAKRVARLLRQAGLQGVSRRPRTATTRRAKDRRPAPDLVERDFSADGPDRLWVADIERHEALLHRVVVKGHRLQSVAAG